MLPILKRRIELLFMNNEISSPVVVVVQLNFATPHSPRECCGQRVRRGGRKGPEGVPHHITRSVLTAPAIRERAALCVSKLPENEPWKARAQ